MKKKETPIEMHRQFKGGNDTDHRKRKELILIPIGKYGPVGGHTQKGKLLKPKAEKNRGASAALG